MHGSSHTFREDLKMKFKDQKETRVIRAWKMCLQKRVFFFFLKAYIAK